MTFPRCDRIFFSAFEPSGDALAAAVIDKLRQHAPHVQIVGFGGPKMRRAGAELLEHSTERAAMGLSVVGQINTHRQRLRLMGGWLDDHPLAALVAVDSPAANWSVCKTVRRRYPNAKILHLAAPQLWAWAPWRIGKLRRLTDLVMCLLPFEPQWFEQRGVPAVFVGHPLFDPAVQSDHVTADQTGRHDSDGLKMALLPGSRCGEIRANWPTMASVYSTLRTQHPQLRGRVAAANEQSQRLIRSSSDGWDDTLEIVTGQTDQVLRWADVSLVVSGTATLQCVARGVPMVAVYNLRRWVWWLWARWVVNTDTFSLPNLIAQHHGLGRVVPELVPHFGDPTAVANAVEPLLSQQSHRRAQRAAFEKIGRLFAHHSFSDLCVEHLTHTLKTPDR